MRAVGHDAWRVAAALLGMAWLCLAQAGDGGLTPFAHSALVTVDAAYTAQGLKLRIARAAGGGAPAVRSITASIDGRSAPATALADGSWLVPQLGASAAGRHMDVVVDHDGIRELLSGELPRAGAPGPSPAAAGAARGGIGGVLHDHQQLAWWVLNITVLLVAAIALSRRFS